MKQESNDGSLQSLQDILYHVDAREGLHLKINFLWAVMESFKSATELCGSGPNCWEWPRIYMGYCLCNTKDGVSLALGIISVISWAVAEIPQIVTNYRQKCAEGLSLTFLFTWLVGDLLNVFGCKLEPATLPTQYYTAILYTLASFILTLQTIYFGYIYGRLKSNRKRYEVIASETEGKTSNDTYGFDKKENDAIHSLEKSTTRSARSPSSPIPLPGLNSSVSPRGELYYRSARSLSTSHTPTERLYGSKRTTSDAGLDPIMEPFLDEVIAAQSAPTPTNIKPLLCTVSFLTLLIGAFNIRGSENVGLVKIYPSPTRRTNLAGRRLLQASGFSLQNGISNKSGGIGMFLGWGMAAIYMGGRLPQICLNIRRGTVQGLNPLMFLFALLGNSTYVASILVRSLDWSKLHPNLPWLVDACGCLLLDTCIVIQFLYFRYRAPRNVENKDIDAENKGCNAPLQARE